MKPTTEQEQALIDGVELALDWGLDVPQEDVEAYWALIERMRENERC